MPLLKTVLSGTFEAGMDRIFKLNNFRLIVFPAKLLHFNRLTVLPISKIILSYFINQTICYVH